MCIRDRVRGDPPSALNDNEEGDVSNLDNQNDNNNDHDGNEVYLSDNEDNNNTPLNNNMNHNDQRYESPSRDNPNNAVYHQALQSSAFSLRDGMYFPLESSNKTSVNEKYNGGQQNIALNYVPQKYTSNGSYVSSINGYSHTKPPIHQRRVDPYAGRADEDYYATENSEDPYYGHGHHAHHANDYYAEEEDIEEEGEGDPGYRGRRAGNPPYHSSAYYNGQRRGESSYGESADELTAPSYNYRHHSASQNRNGNKMGSAQSSGVKREDHMNSATPRKRGRPRLNPGNYDSDGKRRACCNCKRSRCLKLYCDCFAKKRLCLGGCTCPDCGNQENNLKERSSVIAAILERNPSAFKSKTEDDMSETKTSESVPQIAVPPVGNTPILAKGCNCRKSNCLKKYCACFQLGNKCGPQCKCEGCKNQDMQGGGGSSGNYRGEAVNGHGHDTFLGKRRAYKKEEDDEQEEEYAPETYSARKGKNNNINDSSIHDERERHSQLNNSNVSGRQSSEKFFGEYRNSSGSTNDGLYDGRMKSENGWGNNNNGGSITKEMKKISLIQMPLKYFSKQK
eukprot:TRINITY_DN11021_c0_g1_i1.p1 TRINITY_DN11021_c0_g1~~TRINITY_DN11021_c0_g1_i1.p1  ORF type:complete len:585 (-),score=127.45 TRINITY_DN11021_c0_g1_i1:246-1940(-)